MKLEEKVKVNEIIADLLGCDLEEVKDDALLSDHLGADSLDKVELIIEFEKEFDIIIEDEEYWELKTVSEFYKIIETKLS